MSEVSLHPTVQKRDVWTIQDLDTLEVLDWTRYEILDGALVVSPAPGRPHEYAAEELRAVIRPALPTSWIVVGPAGVDVRRSSYFIPDMVVASRDMLFGSGVLGPSEAHLVIEVESPSSVSMDRIVKPAKYAAAGIRHYWRLQTDPLTLSAYRLDGDVHAEVGSWGEGETARIVEPFAVEIDISALLGR